MKKILEIMAVAAVFYAACACTQSLQLPPDPEIEESESGGTVSLLQVSVQDLSLTDAGGNVIPGNRETIWKSGDAIGVYGSASGTNTRFVIKEEYAATGGQAEFYGEEVSGGVTAYMPWQKGGYPAVASGRQPLPGTQNAFDDPYEHMLGNTVLVASASGTELQFRWLTGLARISCAVNVGGRTITAVRLTSSDNPLTGNLSLSQDDLPSVSNGGMTLTVTGLDRGCSEQQPLVFYAMLPPGTYTNIMAGLVAVDGKTISKPIMGSFTIAACKVTEVSVSNQNFNYGNEDFTGEDVAYD